MKGGDGRRGGTKKRTFKRKTSEENSRIRKLRIVRERECPRRGRCSKLQDKVLNRERRECQRGAGIYGSIPPGQRIPAECREGRESAGVATDNDFHRERFLFFSSIRRPSGGRGSRERVQRDQRGVGRGSGGNREGIPGEESEGIRERAGRDLGRGVEGSQKWGGDGEGGNQGIGGGKSEWGAGRNGEKPGNGESRRSGKGGGEGEGLGVRGREGREGGRE
ncbi:hypothetical protein H6P81_020484 [Aristolochia fimbriata]|uniref:Uncharacterized protein n=1 Tax=Aristolochia fimbriata TaxID=158543 RepID=A0AAV7DWE7_ARIFI|nr:hypothetical protein H6P81_020484 [Aristolochia fimbriata]